MPVFLLPILALLGVYIYHWLKKLVKFLRPAWDHDMLRLPLIALATMLAGVSSAFLSMPGLLLLFFWGFSALAELIVWIGKKLWRVHPNAPCALRAVYHLSLLPLALVTLMTVYGNWNMSRIIQTSYTVETDKPLEGGSFRILLLTDAHYGTVQRPEVLKETMASLNAVNSDLVILGGDIVEEGTSREEMQEVFSLLGGIQSRYGVYYVYGNHDRQPYTRNRTFTDEDLTQAITGSGIHILEDETVPIGDEVVLVGRGDAAWGNVNDRPTVDELLEGMDRDKFIVVADHQAVEAEENGRAGADLQLSGHTHAGQIWPAGPLTEWMGVLNYGRYEREGCTVLVSSGLAGWSYPIRTGEHCEYMVVNVRNPAP